MKLKKNLLHLMLLSAGVLFSCGDDDPGVNSQYIIVSDINGKRNISRYDFTSKTFSDPIFTLESNSGGSLFQDVLIDGNYAYAATGYGRNLLRKIDIESGTEIKHVPLPPFQVSMEHYKDKIVVSSMGFDWEQNLSYACIRIYTDDLVLLDSIVDGDAAEIYDTEVVGERLFYSTPGPENTGLIKAVELESLGFAKPVATPLLYMELMKASDTQLLAIRHSGVALVNTVSLQIEKDIRVNSLYTAINRPSCALNAGDKVLYYLHATPQPAYPPFMLFKLDLSTGVTAPVTEFKEYVDGPLVYDGKADVILSGAGGFKIFSRNGKVLDEVSGKGTTLKILIR